MKLFKSFTLAIIILSFGALSAQTQTGEAFEGKIAYDISYEGQKAKQANHPFKMTMWLGNNKTKMQMEGGQMQGMMGDIIIDGDENATYILLHSQKMALKTSHNKGAQVKEDADISIEKMAENEKILGYNTTKYKIIVEGDKENVQYLWVTDELNPMVPNQPSSAAGIRYSAEGVSGFPLMMQQQTKNKGKEVTMTMKATEVSQQQLGEEVFAIPADYKVQEMPGGMLKDR